MLLGCIADDFTGGTDLASMLAAGGLRTVQTIGVPDSPVGEVDAVVVALKSRTTPPAEAVAASLAALRWLQDQGCSRFFFKYCSTFDSTPAGNIGPVAEALMDALGSAFTIACPAYPENGRVLRDGLLTVNGLPLAESPMKDHPLTPMTDSFLPRVLQAQTRRRVGLIGHAAVRGGAAALRAACDRAAQDGLGLCIVDAVSNDDLGIIGEACADLPLLTGGSGLALGLPESYRRRGLLSAAASPAALPRLAGQAVILSGSCSAATQQQVAHWLQRRPGFRIDARRLFAGDDIAAAAIKWARQYRDDGPALIYATADADTVRAVQAEFGVATTAARLEALMGEIAARLAAAGTRTFVVAGGETAGAVVQRLGVHTLHIGPAIAPGVPWTWSSGEDPFLLALKSGNFGAPDFFTQALARLT